MVQKADALAESDIFSFGNKKELKGIEVRDVRCFIGASVTISEAGESEVLKQYLHDFSSSIRLVASEPIRNMATIGGNIVNASPIGDMSIMLLALNADLTVAGPEKTRTIPLRKFFLGYKKRDLSPEEFIRNISFAFSPVPPLFSFEKVSRRTHLDIASVNSAIQLRMAGDTVAECHLSAGGVSPVPLYLERTCAFLTGRPISAEIVLQADEIMQEEISPISDARGSAEYKRLLLRQLLLAHFLKLFPERIKLSRGPAMNNPDAISHSTGKSQYLDDIPVLKNTLYGVIFGSPSAHGKIAGLDLTGALSTPGVQDINPQRHPRQK